MKTEGEGRTREQWSFLPPKVAMESQLHLPSRGEVALCVVRGIWMRTLTSDMPKVSHGHPGLYNKSALPLSSVMIQDHGERQGGHFSDATYNAQVRH